jgi:segregation and condensation protein A
MQDYKVKIEIFEGPMDLLLHLIRINEMDIYDIPIAEITRAYLGYLHMMESLDLEVAGEFLVMASTLLNIKLRALLPDSPEGEEEGEEIDNILTARMLMEKLVEYRRFKEAASELHDREQRQASVFFREVALPKLADARQDEAVRSDLESLLQAFRRVLRFVEARGYHLVTEEEYSTEEKMDSLLTRLALEERIEVDELFRSCQSKVEMIVYLLAILELYHEKRLRIEQNAAFSSIYIFARTPEEEDAEPQLADPTEIDLGEPAPVPGPLAQVIEVGAAAEDDEETFET